MADPAATKIDATAANDACKLVKKFLRGKPMPPAELSALRAILRPVFEIDADAALIENIENFRKMRDDAEDVDVKIKAERQIFLVLREMNEKKRALQPTGGADAAADCTRHLKPLYPKHDDPDAMCRAAAQEIGKARAAIQRPAKPGK